jgi:hypothetical protein
MYAKPALSVGLGQSGIMAGKAVQAQNHVTINAAVGRQVSRETVSVFGCHHFEI